MKYIITCLVLSFCNFLASAQDASRAANNFISSLSKDQQLETVFPFESDERYNFHFFPKERKGITFNEMNDKQRNAAVELMRIGISENAMNKIDEIRSLENILKVIEKRPPGDKMRDSGNYHFSIFGIPDKANIWGWRFEGHHVTFNFSSVNGHTVSGTPSFLGANPAIVSEGPSKGFEVLKQEARMGFNLLHSLNTDQLSKAIVNLSAPNEIITFVNRKATLIHPDGISFKELIPNQQQQLLLLCKEYLNRYTKLLAEQMFKEIQKDGLENLSFAWAGSTQQKIGNPHYYRIQGPGIIIEYDNSQNNGNHVHSVIRDLKNDFGGDPLMDHYKSEHQLK
ncbi:MAG: DUF3500 domain-containing protein [Ginsengibacter sp.]